MEMRRAVVETEGLRASAEDGERTFEGYAMVYGILDDHGTVFAKGAFADSLNRGSKIPMLWGHDSGSPIGVWESIEENARGLKVRGRLAGDAVRQANEAYELLRMEAINGLSVGFTIPRGGIEGGDSSTGDAVIKKANLREISVVAVPSNPKSLITKVRGADITIREWERRCREDLGLSRGDSKGAAKAITQYFRGREAEAEGPERREAAGAIEAIERLRRDLKKPGDAR